MKAMRFVLTMIIILACTSTYAQDIAPTLTGKIEISVTKGTIACDFHLKNMPRIANSYVIRINSGMNIHYFKDLAHGNLLYYETDNQDTLSSGESTAYFFPGNENKGRFLPEELEMKYTGMYPIEDSANGYNVHDWRGNVAFNGYSLRADGLQSAWYPILFDSKTQKMYEDVRYDITVTCPDCTTLFVTGNKPVKGTKAEFKSTTPRPLTMYCGKYGFSNMNGTFLLNPDMNKMQQTEFLKTINAYKNFYEKNLGIAYKDDITFIQTTPTSDPKRTGFLFVSYPTIVNIGIGDAGLHAMFDKENGDFYKPYLAHELGHYYFGTILNPNTEFGPVIDEGFAEYLSFTATKKLFADSIYKHIIAKKIKDLDSFTAMPLSRVKSEKDFGSRELYVYYYVPIMLTAIEKEIGEKAMWQWLKIMLTTKADFTDYAFFEKTFDLALPDQVVAKKIKEKYFTSTDALASVIKEIQ